MEVTIPHFFTVISSSARETKALRLVAGKQESLRTEMLSLTAIHRRKIYFYFRKDSRIFAF